jgi:hypothetical protein
MFTQPSTLPALLSASLHAVRQTASRQSVQVQEAGGSRHGQPFALD